jgi:hypothetical protein
MDENKADPGRSLALGKSQTLVRIMDRARTITEGLKDNNERACFKAFLRRHPGLLVEGLSRNYPLDADILAQFARESDWPILVATGGPAWDHLRTHHPKNDDDWDWGALSRNQSLPWSLELIEHFAGNWDWEALSLNPALPWSLTLIEHFFYWWNWERLSESPALPWDMELISRFGSSWNWERLSENPSLPWTSDIIEYFADQWNWERLTENSALLWSLELIERYEDYWDWSLLSRNSALPWSLTLIERYLDRWHWGNFSRNPGAPWTLAFIERYADRWDWEALSRNEALPWTQDLLERYAVRWDWDGGVRLDDGPIGSGLSGNIGLPWSIELIERYEDRWNWGWPGLTGNVALPWSLDLIERYKDRWDWEWLSDNPALPWTDSLIERYADQWDWIGDWERQEYRWAWLYNNPPLDADTEYQSGLSGNRALPWSPALIDCFMYVWYWLRLSRNPALPWNSALLERFESCWDFEQLAFNPLPMWRILQREDIIELMDELAPPLAFADGWKVFEVSDCDRVLAQFNLGLLYAEGIVVAKDTGNALYWHRKAAEQGYAEAQGNLDLIYERGRRVTQVYTEAVQRYRKSAEPRPNQATASAAKNVTSALDKAVGFGDNDLWRGVSFDEETYAKARPHFESLWVDAKAAGKDIKEFFEILIKAFGSRVKPYAIQFAKEWEGHQDAEKARLNAQDESSVSRLSDDPEWIQYGIEMAGFHIEAGELRFVDVAHRLAEDLDVPLDQIKSFLQQWYNGAREFLKSHGYDVSEVDDAATVNAGMEVLFSGKASRKTRGQGVTELSYKPDYGLRLMQDGISRAVDHNFYDFRLYSLTLLGPGQYSTVVEMPFAGELHALSLDFNQEQLVQILTHATPQLASFIRNELAGDSFTLRTIDFMGEVVFGVRARLGEIQRVERETFVPFIAQEVI